MTKEQIATIFANIPAGHPIKITCDNMMIYDTRTSVIKFDDELEMVHVFRSNDNHYTSAQYACSYETFRYDDIQYIGTEITTDDMEKMAASLGVDTTGAIYKQLLEINNFEMAPNKTAAPKIKNNI